MQETNGKFNWDLRWSRKAIWIPARVLVAYRLEFTEINHQREDSPTNILLTHNRSKARVVHVAVSLCIVMRSKVICRQGLRALRPRER